MWPSSVISSAGIGAILWALVCVSVLRCGQSVLGGRGEGQCAIDAGRQSRDSARRQFRVPRCSEVRYAKVNVERR